MQRIFDPLGIKDTAFSVPPERLDRLATSYGGNVKNRWARSARWCENMVAILMTQRAAFPLSWGVYLDFWTSAYEAIDD